MIDTTHRYRKYCQNDNRKNIAVRSGCANNAAMDLVSLLLLLLSMMLLMETQVGALRLVDVKVPAYLKKDESASLECRYDLESDKLYSVSWYKDNEHIYSFLHQHGPKKLAFTLEGVRIDTHKSNGQVLYLQSVSLDSSGYYACEVNTDSRPFKSVKGEAYMEVIEPPREDPKITGEEKIYATGDVLALNCTSGYSHPEARIRWLVNDVPIDDPNTEVRHSTSRSGLRSTRSSLRLELNPLHLAEGKIEVTCESTVQTSQLSREPFIDTRAMRIFVEGHANISSPSTSLMLIMLLMTVVYKNN